MPQETPRRHPAADQQRLRGSITSDLSSPYSTRRDRERNASSETPIPKFRPSAVGASDQDQQQAAPAHCTEPTSAPILPPVFPHRAYPEVPFPPISPTPGGHVWAHLDTERRQAEPELGRSAGISRGNPLVGSGALGGIRTPNLLIRSQMLYPLSYERSGAT